MHLKQRYLLTGANSDIAGAAARLLAERGAEVVGLDMVEAADPELFTSFLLLDLSEPGAAGRLGRLLGDQPLAGLMGVAGARLRPEFETQWDGHGWLEPEAFAAVVADNLLTQYVALNGSRDALVKGAEQWGQASATLVGSINAFAGYGGPAYSAGKAGLHGLMVAVTKPLGRFGVRINIVAPGTVDSPSRRQGEPLDDRERSALSETTALNKLATPGDIASALVSIACDLSQMTGQTLVIDGGQLVVRD